MVCIFVSRDEDNPALSPAGSAAAICGELGGADEMANGADD